MMFTVFLAQKNPTLASLRLKSVAEIVATSEVGKVAHAVKVVLHGPLHDGAPPGVAPVVVRGADGLVVDVERVRVAVSLPS